MAAAEPGPERPRVEDAPDGFHDRQQLEGQAGPTVTIAWQGGEPTLRGVLA
jgi:hypothetical protein